MTGYPWRRSRRERRREAGVRAYVDSSDLSRVLNDLAVIRQRTVLDELDVAPPPRHLADRDFYLALEAVGRRRGERAQDAHAIVAVRIVDHQARALNARKALDDVRDLMRVNEKPPDLRGLIRPSHPALDALVGAPARTETGKQRRQIARGESDQRVFAAEHRRDDFAHFALGNRIAGARAHDLDDHALVDDEAFARLGFVRDGPEIRGGVGLERLNAARGEMLAQRRGKRLARYQRFFEKTQVAFEILGLIEDQFQERRGAGVPDRAQVRHGRYLQLGLADAAGDDGATERDEPAFHHRAGRRQVIGETILHDVAGAKAGREQRPRRAPVIGLAPFGVVDRPRRNENFRERAGNNGVHAAE